MEKFKIFFLQYFDKIAIAIAFALLAYSGFCLYKSLSVSDSIKKIQEYSPILENNIKTAKVPTSTALNYATIIKSEFMHIPKDKMEKIQSRRKTIIVKLKVAPITKKEFVPGLTEILFKGGTPDKALIVIKKKEQDKLFEQSFVTRIGEAIGANEPVGEKKLTDFLTGCTLIDIVHNAKKTLSTQHKFIKVNDVGEFVSTQTESVPYQISSIKIKYQNDRLNGAIKDLWLGQTANLGTVTPLLETNNTKK